MSNGEQPEPEPEIPGSHCHRCLLSSPTTTPQPDGSELCPDCQDEHEAWKWEAS